MQRDAIVGYEVTPHTDYLLRKCVSNADRRVRPQATGIAPHYQLQVSREGQLDILTVQVERKADASSSDRATIADALRKNIRDYVGVSTRIKVGDPGEVARSEGKAVRVIYERK
jgi:phenylacetate-CoA ligase